MFAFLSRMLLSWGPPSSCLAQPRMLHTWASVVRITPRCPSPRGRPLAALLRPRCSSPVRQWCAVPRLPQSTGPPSCRLARLRRIEYGALVVRGTPVAPVQGAVLLLPCSPPDVRVRGVGGPRSQGCSSPEGCLRGALLCPECSSPVRRWSAVPQSLQSRGPPSCHLALPRILQSGASCLHSPYAPILRLVILPLLISSSCSRPAICPQLILVLVRWWLRLLCQPRMIPSRAVPLLCSVAPVGGAAFLLRCSAPDVEVRGVGGPRSPGCPSPGGRPLAALLPPVCSSQGRRWSADPWLLQSTGPPSCRLTLPRMFQSGALVVHGPPVAPDQGASVLPPCSAPDVPVRGVRGPRPPVPYSRALSRTLQSGAS